MPPAPNTGTTLRILWRPSGSFAAASVVVLRLAIRGRDGRVSGMSMHERTAVPNDESLTDGGLAALAVDLESELVERKAAFKGDVPNAVREAVCGFANDMPGHGRPGCAGPA